MSGLSILQKIDKELESALATLEKEKEEALKDLDAQVSVRSVLAVLCCYVLIYVVCAGWKAFWRNSGTCAP